MNFYTGDFRFKENGQEYVSLGELSSDRNVKVLEIIDKNKSVPAPRYSHTENRIYAIAQNGKLKYVAYYNKNHERFMTIDFSHRHDGLIPHIHFGLEHKKDDKVSSINMNQAKLINKIKREFNLL